jgi:hypothetical protein
MPLDSMPAENRRRPHDNHDLEQRARSGRQRRDQASVQSAEPGTRRGASEHDELVAKQEVLGGDNGARGEESRGGSNYVAKEVDHRAILGPTVWHVQPCPTPTHQSFCGAQVKFSLAGSTAANSTALAGAIRG